MPHVHQRIRKWIAASFRRLHLSKAEVAFIQQVKSVTFFSKGSWARAHLSVGRAPQIIPPPSSSPYHMYVIRRAKLKTKAIYNLPGFTNCLTQYSSNAKRFLIGITDLVGIFFSAMFPSNQKYVLPYQWHCLRLYEDFQYAPVVQAGWCHIRFLTV